jgi:hypothetical protein
MQAVMQCWNWLMSSPRALGGFKMTRKKPLSTWSELHAKLEAERLDLSYRIVGKAPEVQIIKQVVNIVPEELKKLYFNAGRYSAGDRDEIASEAYGEFLEREH